MWLIWSVHCYPFLIEIFTFCSQCRHHTKKEMERLQKRLDVVETHENSDFDNEDNGSEDVLEENFAHHESFSEHDTESVEDRDSGNKEVNNLE
ncbi:hypothetical protein AVEN_44766-1 [Araneus ventricosus]|uniref:Uncharacterized protein n=1 Tax=Araneus ventricosus TaxID=182803 RepID=A0A4Y2LRV8_ARAVE|nr:hypothetical protein AVEN_44766-1 [Araneus ventricosus]